MVFYDITLWYNAVEDLGNPLAKAVKVEPVFTHLDAPNVTGEEMFFGLYRGDNSS